MEPWANGLAPATHRLVVRGTSVLVIGTPAAAIDIESECAAATSLVVTECSSFAHITNVPRTVNYVRIERMSEVQVRGLVEFLNTALPKSVDTIAIVGSGIVALNDLNLGSVRQLSVECRDLQSLTFGEGTTSIETLHVSNCDELAEMPDISRVQRVRDVRLADMRALGVLSTSRLPAAGVRSLFVERCLRFRFDEEIRVDKDEFRLSIWTCAALTRVPAMRTAVCSLTCENVPSLKVIETAATGMFIDVYVMNAPQLKLTQRIRVFGNSTVCIFGASNVTQRDFVEFVHPFGRETVPRGEPYRPARGEFLLHVGNREQVDLTAVIEKKGRLLSAVALAAHAHENSGASPFRLSGMQDMLKGVKDMLEGVGDEPAVQAAWWPLRRGG